MIDTIKDLFRRRKLKKHACDVPTGFLPMSEIYTVNVMIDVEEPGFDALREDILAWGRSIKAKVNIYFFDFRRLGKEELLLTSIQTTILRKELDWTDAPDVKKVANLLEEQSDLFISMIDNGRNDEKIIAIPFGDPTYNEYKDISQLPKHIFDEMTHFFTVYKMLENKDTAIDEAKGVLAAVDIIEDAIEGYKKEFVK